MDATYGKKVFTMKRECTIFYCGEGIWDSLEWMEKTGSDPYGIRIMTEKNQIYPIYIENMYFAAGNIIKQDLLSLGGDAVVHKFFVNAKKEYGNVLLLGTAKHYRMLQTKMYAQHWGLKELGAELRIIMENLLYHRDHRQESLEQTTSAEISIDFTGLSTEEIMKQLPLRRAKNEGFARLPIPEEQGQSLTKLYHPALSRGYVLEIK